MSALVAQPTTTRMFMARRHDLRLVKTPRYPLHGPGGEKVGEREGEALQFVGGRFDCPESGEVTLEDGRRVAAGPILKWLESHKLLGDVYEGFIAVDPAKPAPTSDELERIVEAGIVGDEDTLLAIIEQEEAGFARDAILKPARTGLEKVREILAKLKEAERVEAERAAAEVAKAQAAKPADSKPAKS